jgi:nitrogen regulatory protein P-II 1
MKEIKAYIRREQVTEVVQHLEQAGAPGISLTEVHPVGYGYEPEYFRLGPEDVFHKHPQTMATIEIVCPDERADELANLIKQASHTGYRGDGMVFVSPVETAVRIRDDATNEAAL